MEHRAELVEVIRRIRNRWRMRLAARGAVVVFVGTVLVLLLSASTLEAIHGSASPAIIAFRILLVAVFGGARRLRGWCRCAGRSPTPRSRSTSRSTIPRSKRRF